MEFKNVKEATESYEKLQLENEGLKKSEANVKTLEAENKAFKKENNEQATKIKVVEDKNTDLETQLAELNVVTQSKDAKIDGLEKKIEELEEDIEDLNALVTEVRNSKSIGNKKMFTHKSKDYEVSAATFKFEGKELTADDVVGDKELQAKLVELGVGFIVEIKEEES